MNYFVAMENSLKSQIISKNSYFTMFKFYVFVVVCLQCYAEVYVATHRTVLYGLNVTQLCLSILEIEFPNENRIEICRDKKNYAIDAAILGYTKGAPEHMIPARGRAFRVFGVHGSGYRVKPDDLNKKLHSIGFFENNKNRIPNWIPSSRNYKIDWIEIVVKSHHNQRWSLKTTPYSCSYSSNECVVTYN
jgi:hypothetical protein